MSRLLQDYVTRAAERDPDSVALAMGEERLTYAQLELDSSRLARLLAGAGARRGDRVCMLLPKSPVAIMAMQAILKADCVYVPLDVDSPPARLAKIVHACGPRLVLACAETAALAGALTGAGLVQGGTTADGLAAGDPAGEGPVARDLAIGFVDDADGGGHVEPVFRRADWAGEDAHALAPANTPEDLAYVLFTSGSTGTPKGVMISHANVAHFAEWTQQYFGTVPGDRLSGHPPLHFDLSTLDIYGAFVAGAELHLVPAATGGKPGDLVAFIRDRELSQWVSVPSALTFMAKYGDLRQDDLPHLKRLMWCGEVLPTTTAIHWMRRLPHVRFTNLYGPTEATVASSFHTLAECPVDDTEPIPIGVACPGEQLTVLDDELRELTDGQPGEIYIGGAGVARGYWEDEERTVAAFRLRPGSPDQADERVLGGAAQDGDARWYRTGDLGRLGDDGLLYFLGRADSQIKSRGYRIELGEIEAAVNALEGVKECAVVGVGTDGFEGTAICCAYASPAEAAITDAQLRRGLARLLPPYMLPSRWLALAELPKNLNGKIDRVKLRARFEAGTDLTAPGADERDAAQALDEFGASLLDERDPALDRGGRPQSTWAQRIAALPDDQRAAAVLDVVRGQLTAMLGLDASELVLADGAFGDLGVDSLAAVELRNRLGSVTGLRLPATLVFDHPTAAAVAEFLLVQVQGGVAGGGGEVRLRQAIASIPLARLRDAGLLDALLELAGVDGGVDEVEARGDGVGDSIDDMGVDDLVQRVLQGSTAGAGES